MLWSCVLAAWILLPGIIGDWQESPNRWIPILCYATALQFFLQLWSWKTVSGGLFDPYVVFLTAATLFNAGRALLATLPDGSLESPFQPSTALYGLYIIALALCSFHLGGLIAIASAGTRLVRARASLAIPNATLRSVGGWLVLVAIVPMSILMKQAVAGVMRDGYGVALYTNEAATSFAATPSVLAAFLVPGAFLLLAGSAKRVGLRATTAIIVAVYSGSLLFIGWRAAAISVAISYIWLWHRCVRAIPRAAILSLGALLLAIMPAIAAMRNLTGPGPRVLRHLCSIGSGCQGVLRHRRDGGYLGNGGAHNDPCPRGTALRLRCQLWTLGVDRASRTFSGTCIRLYITEVPKPGWYGGSHPGQP